MLYLRKTERLCFFIGTGRSGSSLVAAILNAHPKIVLAREEFFLLRRLRANTHTPAGKRRQLGALIHHAYLQGAREQQQTRPDNEFLRRHHIEGGYQRMVSSPVVLGEKSSSYYSMLARKRGPEELEATLNFGRDWRLHFIQTLRNPYDMIATAHRYRKNEPDHYLFQETFAWRKKRFTEHFGGDNDPMEPLLARARADLDKGQPLLYLAAHFFSRFEGVQLMKKYGSNIIDVHYKHMTENPEQEIRRVVAWLGLDMTDSYVRDCKNIVRPMTRSRHEIENLYTPDVRALIDEQIKRFDFLQGYGWDTDDPFAP